MALHREPTATAKPSMVYPNVPPQEIVDWMLKSGKVEDGAIVICDSNDVPLEKVYFEKGVCIGLNINYSQEGNSFVTTNISVQANVIKVGTSILENRWV
jgi:hypothetical protein